ncbi:MAG: hydrogenase maturation nickel metallochaperone HypA [Clostridia bacterium]|nr:hydrogenase maturation nickel metallochaperone HypA [Clostridia bacterium]
MHELGIVMNVVKQVEEVAAENKVNKVTQLNLEVGEVSSIVPDLFRDCFEWAKKRTTYLKECELNLIVLEGISYCRSCKKTYKTTEYAKECPYCKGHDTYLVTGNEVSIRDIKVE